MTIRKIAVTAASYWLAAGLAACGGGSSAPESVELANQAPVADAGIDFSVTEGEVATLSGAGSSDPDGDTITYSWQQESGTPVALSSATAMNPEFVVPALVAPETIELSLQVSDSAGLSASDSVLVTLLPAQGPGAVATGPSGIYVLSNGPSTGNIRDHDFIEGYVLRMTWAEVETAPGVYDFGVVENALTALAAIDQQLTLQILVFDTPDHVVAQANETWTTSLGGIIGVPWDRPQLEAWKQFAQTLADHTTTLSDGSVVRLADHPVLESVSSPIAGLQGIRELTGTLVSLPSYDRDLFIDSISESVHAIRDVFSNKYGFISVFKLDDADTVNPLDSAIVDRLQSEFNGPGQPTLGFFQELLSDVGPNPDGLGVQLLRVNDTAYIMFQALTSWTSPFADPDKVASGTPATGISLGFSNYGALYYELYIADIDNVDLHNDLRAWNTFLTSQ